MTNTRSVRLDRFSKPISNGALLGEELPNRIKVLNWGRNDTLKGEVLVDYDTARVFKANQKKIGRELAPIDFDHNTVEGTPAFKALNGTPPVIFGYGTPVVIPEDGIYFENIQWTPHGNQHARDFADISPTPMLDENGRVLALASAALTPAGAVEGLSFYSLSGPLEPLSADSEEKGDEYDCLRAFDADDHYSRYGDVEYADPENHKYPINNEKHIRAAWSYINMPKNSSKYSGDKLAAMKRKIRAAAKKNGIQIAEPHNASTAVRLQVMSAHTDYFRKACHLAADLSDDDVKKHVTRTMSQHLRADDADSDDTVMEHLSAVMGHVKSNPDPANQPSMAPGPEFMKLVAEIADPLKAQITALSADLSALKTFQANELANADKARKDALVAQATAEGKVIPFSADVMATLTVAQMENLVATLKKDQIPMRRTALRPLSATPEKKTMADSARAIDEQIANGSSARPLTF